MDKYKEREVTWAHHVLYVGVFFVGCFVDALLLFFVRFVGGEGGGHKSK